MTTISQITKKRNQAKDDNRRAVTFIRQIGMANSLRVKLRYSEDINITCTAGASTGYVFSANGIYDPNISSTGHQPMMFDQYMAFYNHYVVHKSEIKVVVWPGGAQFAMCGVWLKDDLTSISGNTLSYIIEQGALMGNASAPRALGHQYAQPVLNLRQRYSALNFFAVKDVLERTDQQGTIASNPTEQAYYHVWMCGNQYHVTTFSCVMTVTIEYDVQFTEVKPMPQS